MTPSAAQSASVVEIPEVSWAPYVHPKLVRKVCPDESRGQGVFTSRRLERGELLLASPPLAAVQGVPEDLLADSLADEILVKLKDNVDGFAEKFWSLSSGPESAEPESDEPPRKRPKQRDTAAVSSQGAASDLRKKVLRIIAVNAHGWPSEEQKGLGLWQWQAYMNHADPTDANCSSIFIGEVLLMRALREIEVDEEILNSYCPPSASLTVRQAILRHTCVPSKPLSAELSEHTQSLGEAVQTTSSMLKAAMDAIHGSNAEEGEKLLKEVLSIGAQLRPRIRPEHLPVAAIPVLTEFLRLQLRSSRCLGDMALAAANHAAVARSMRREQALHVEVLAHWLAHLRAGGGDGDAFSQVESLSRFWLGRSVGLSATSEWLCAMGLGPRRI